MGFFESNLARLGYLCDSILDRVSERLFPGGTGRSGNRLSMLRDGRAAAALQDFFDRCDDSLARRGIRISTAKSARIAAITVLCLMIAGVGLLGWSAMRVPKMAELTEAEKRASTDLSQRINSQRLNAAMTATPVMKPKQARPTYPKQK